MDPSAVPMSFVNEERQHSHLSVSGSFIVDKSTIGNVVIFLTHTDIFVLTTAKMEDGNRLPSDNVFQSLPVLFDFVIADNTVNVKLKVMLDLVFLHIRPKPSDILIPIDLVNIFVPIHERKCSRVQKIVFKLGTVTWDVFVKLKERVQAVQ